MSVDVKSINPFIQSAISMLKTVAAIEFERGRVNLIKGKTMELGPTIVVKLAGAIKGKVFYEFSDALAIKIVEVMNEIKHTDMPRTQFDMLLEETILEIGNLISGRAITVLSMDKTEVSISTPELERNIGVELVSEDHKVLTLPLKSKSGDFAINLHIDGL